MLYLLTLRSCAQVWMNPRTDRPVLAAIPARLRAPSPLRPLLDFLRQRLGLLLLWPVIGLLGGCDDLEQLSNFVRVPLHFYQRW